MNISEAVGIEFDRFSFIFFEWYEENVGVHIRTAGLKIEKQKNYT